MAPPKEAPINIMHAYYLYASVLALSLVALKPLITFMKCEAEKLERAYSNGLKNLTPFWIIAALYTTIKPDPKQTLMLFRGYAATNAVMVASVFLNLPPNIKQVAFLGGIAITTYMASQVITVYKDSF